MITDRIVSIGCFALGALFYAAGSGQDYPDAYTFPNLLALVMSVLSLIMIVTADIDPNTRKSVAVESVPWITLWPAFASVLIYLLVAETLGFFTSSFLLFVLLGAMYSEQSSMPFLTNRCVPVALLFFSVLYSLFVLLLKVQMPEGILF